MPSDLRLRRAFDRLHRDVCRKVGDIDVTLMVGREVEFPLVRNYAYCADTSPIRIVVAPKIVGDSEDRIEAVLRHEFGHAVDFAAGPREITALAGRLKYPMPTTPERRADEIAYLVWGDRIRYDTDTVQSLCRGVTPRPSYLGL